MTTEHERLQQSRERSVHWKRWGPYLSERAWGTVREDYSPNGTAWDYLPHDHARSRAFRWGEDGLGGISDRHQQLCFALALWNGRDPILKERLFGLTGEEGNHGEDVKEYYYYLDNTPTHSYMKYLYKYPQAAYPYAQLVEENRRRDRTRPEYELIDTGIFDDDRYFDIFVEYAKAGPEDILIRVTVINRGNEQAKLDLLPTLWFRNTWSWIPNPSRPILSRYRPAFAFPTHTVIEARSGNDVDNSHVATGSYLGNRWLYCETPVDLLFTENETNQQRLFGVLNTNPYVKDGINEYIVHGNHEAVNPAQVGTKAAAHYQLTLAAGETRTIRMRFSNQTPEDILPFDSSFDTIFAQNIKEADDFYATIIPQNLSEDAKSVQRQAFAGMLWSKEFYFYDVKVWLNGDPTQPAPPPERLNGRNHEWTHLYNADVISMPDKWEYPWYAAWDLAFHCVAFAFIDPDFAKEQLILLLREWYLHPNGQIPAYEWAFGDVNPPVHAWAAYHVYKIEQQATGKGDREFLEKIFQKLLLNFTWWVNRKDYEGQNVFQGGFLGLDNIGVFDRNLPLPDGSYIEQSDGTSWMGMYCLNMLTIALELARENRAYSDIASKFFEHFVFIAHAMNEGSNGIELWDEQDGFYYDVLHHEDKTHLPLKVHSMVGLIPLFAISILESDLVDQLPSFQRRMQWFINNWIDINDHLERREDAQHNEKLLLAIVNADKLPRVLKVMLDEAEFLSRYGLRALSRYHLEHPYMIEVNGINHMIDYEPAESNSGLFGGNSNWRGPIWFPLNYLIIESLQTFHHFYGDEFKIEFPTDSGKLLTLEEVAIELAHRLTTIFLRDESGRRAVHGDVEKFQRDPYWRDLVLFYEYFHGDNGAGLGASHQTGWTGLVANLLLQSSKGQTHTLMHETTQMPG
ncbi:MAG: MGH1-like glycoside hydrolase domain-containing protein [Ktedonobacteraceae bacterium]